MTIEYRVWDVGNQRFITDSSTISLAMDGNLIINGVVDTSHGYEIDFWTGRCDESGAKIYENDCITDYSEGILMIMPFSPVSHSSTRLLGAMHCDEKIVIYLDSDFGDDDWISWPETYKIIGNLHEFSGFFQPGHYKNVDELRGK